MNILLLLLSGVHPQLLSRFRICPLSFRTAARRRRCPESTSEAAVKDGDLRTRIKAKNKSRRFRGQYANPHSNTYHVVGNYDLSEVVDPYHCSLQTLFRSVSTDVAGLLQLMPLQLRCPDLTIYRSFGIASRLSIYLARG